MNVKLINYTQDALELLLGTKNTRLAHSEDVATWSPEKKAEHLSYMRDTIKSSWEFVDYVFEIEGVTRSFTHQLVRTRQGSYAQESQRTVDVSDHEVTMPESIRGTGPGLTSLEILWGSGVHTAKQVYSELLRHGVPVQDARDILPTGMNTSIKAKFNLRTLHEMAKVRLCTRTQGLYQDVFRAMRAEVIAVHPWVAEHRFIEVACVSDGICAFPRFGRKECQIYDPAMDQDKVKETAHQKFWSLKKQVAVPVAKDGKTM